MRGADGALSGRRGVDAYGVAWVRAKTRTRVRRAHVRGRALRPSVHMATVHRATVGSAVCDPRWRPLEEDVKAVEKILVEQVSAEPLSKIFEGISGRACSGFATRRFSSIAQTCSRETSHVADGVFAPKSRADA